MAYGYAYRIDVTCAPTYQRQNLRSGRVDIAKKALSRRTYLKPILSLPLAAFQLFANAIRSV